jgi:hypothetical protein
MMEYVSGFRRSTIGQNGENQQSLVEMLCTYNPSILIILFLQSYANNLDECEARKLFQ